MPKQPIKCYFTLGGINYKNGFVTSCPQQTEQMYIIEGTDKIAPSQIINSENFKKHRLKMMSGTWSKGCHLCQEVEENNAGHNMRMDFPPDDTYYNSSTGEIDFRGLKHTELRFSNACNMACLHCSDVYSSGWMSKLKHYTPDEEDKKHKLIQLTRTMHRASRNDKLSIDLDTDNMATIVNDLNANFPNLEKIDFAGGEVLYQKQFLPCLELLALHPNAKNLWITFHTNFNVKADFERLYNALIKFGNISIMISVDAGTNIYPYFRTGNWDVLRSNLEYFNSLDVERKVYITTVVTTSIYQMMDIENIFMSLLTLDVIRINASTVYTPAYLNPALIKLYFEEEMKNDFQELRMKIYRESVRRKKNKEFHLRSYQPDMYRYSDLFYAFKALENMETYIKNTPVTKENYDAFLVYVKKTDSIWKQNFNDHFKKYQYIENQIVRTNDV